MFFFCGRRKTSSSVMKTADPSLVVQTLVFCFIPFLGTDVRAYSAVADPNASKCRSGDVKYDQNTCLFRASGGLMDFEEGSRQCVRQGGRMISSTLARTSSAARAFLERNFLLSSSTMWVSYKSGKYCSAFERYKTTTTYKLCTNDQLVVVCSRTASAAPATTQRTTPSTTTLKACPPYDARVQCPVGWSNHADFCWRKVQGYYTWSEGRAACVRLGGAMIGDNLEECFVEKLNKAIGDRTRAFSWTNTDSGRTNYCGAMNFQPVEYTSEWCTTTKHVFCTMKPGSSTDRFTTPAAVISTPTPSDLCPSDGQSRQCPVDWSEHGGFCWWKLDGDAQWEFGRNICSAHGAKMIGEDLDECFVRKVKEAVQTESKKIFWIDKKVTASKCTTADVQGSEVTMWRNWCTSKNKVICVLWEWEKAGITSFKVKDKSPNAQNVYDLDEGSHVTFDCQTFGIPSPNSEIYFSQPGQTGKQKKSANQEISCSMSGIYTCQAWNQFNEKAMEKYVQVSVKCKKAISSFTIAGRTTDISVVKGTKQSFYCSTKGFKSPTILLVNADSGQEVARSTQSSLRVTTPEFSCGFMSVYTCQVRESDGSSYVSESLEVAVSPCAPQFCSRQTQNVTVTASVGDTFDVTICVLSAVLPTVRLNDSSFEVANIARAGHGQLQARVTVKDQSNLYYSVNVKVIGVTDADFGPLKVHLSSYIYPTYYSSMAFILIKQDNKGSTRPTSSTVSDLNVQDSDEEEGGSNTTIAIIVPIAILVILVITAIAVCRIRVQRKRHRQGLTSNAQELDKAGGHNEYASIKDSELRGSNSPTPACQPGDHGDGNTYANTHTQMTQEQTSSDGRTVNEAGLVYITLAETSQSKASKKPAVKPAKYEPVTYVTVDFDKTGHFVVKEDDGEESEGQKE